MQQKIIANSFIRPDFFRSLPTEGVVQGGKITIGLQVLIPEGEPYPDGTPVQIWCDRFFFCESLASLEKKKAERIAKYQERLEAKTAKEIDRIKASKSFNASLNIPVEWTPEYKHVLSGLLESSNGDGLRRNSQTHVYLREPLSGRLAREANSFLCQSSRGAHFNDLIQGDNQSKVTCKACLKIAKRWSQNPDREIVCEKQSTRGLKNNV